MQSSFTQALRAMIYARKGKTVSLNRVHEFAEKMGVKQRTAERRLNVGESPFIETLYDSKRHITGYRSIIQS